MHYFREARGKRLFRRLVPLCLLLILLVPSAVFGASSSGAVDVSFMTKDIYIDGKLVNNYFLSRPVTMSSSGTVYVPCTRDLMRALGLEFKAAAPEKNPVPATGSVTPGYVLRRLGALLNQYSEALGSGKPVENLSGLAEFKTLEKGDTSLIGSQLVYNLVYSDRLTPVTGYVVLLEDSFLSEEADLTGLKEGDGTRSCISFSGTGLLMRGSDCWWIPLYAFADGRLGVSTYYDSIGGLYFSTDPDIPASAYHDPKGNPSYIKGLAGYICDAQGDINEYQAQLYEYFFRHEATIYGVDQLIIMGVARNESTFYADAVGGGAVGIMQTMAKYAPNYGYSREMLFNPHYSIELGSMYLRDRIWSYGDIKKALTAYNRGSLSGSYTYAYANKILKFKSNMEEYLKNRGCPLQFKTQLQPLAG